MPAAETTPPTVLATGCASGIGRRLAQLLAERGHRLLATDVDREGLDRCAAEFGWRPPQVELLTLDVRDPAAWQLAVERAVQCWGRLDIVLNVAGIVYPGWAHEISPEKLLAHLHVNAAGVMLGTQAAARRMVEQGHGHIVNIASMAGLAPVPGIAGYSASKFAVRGFTLAVAQELRPRGVYVSCVCPDAVETPMLDAQMTDDAAALTFSGPRLLGVDEVARVIVEKVLVRRPLEVLIPRKRGWLAKFTSAFPGTESWLLPSLVRTGRRRQAAYRERRKSEG